MVVEPRVSPTPWIQGEKYRVLVLTLLFKHSMLRLFVVSATF